MEDCTLTIGRDNETLVEIMFDRDSNRDPKMDLIVTIHGIKHKISAPLDRMGILALNLYTSRAIHEAYEPIAFAHGAPTSALAYAEETPDAEIIPFKRD